MLLSVALQSDTNLQLGSTLLMHGFTNTYALSWLAAQKSPGSENLVTSIPVKMASRISEGGAQA